MARDRTGRMIGGLHAVCQRAVCLRAVWVGVAVAAVPVGLFAAPPDALPAAATSHASATAAPSIDDFFPDTELRALSLSPDGRHLALVVEVPAGRDRVRLLDASTLDTVREFETSEVDLVAVHWATPERMLVETALSMTFRIGSTRTVSGVPTRHLISMELDGSDPVVLLQGRDYEETTNRADIVSRLPDDPRHILLTAVRKGVLRLAKVDVLTGESREVERGRDWTFAWDVARDGTPTVRYDGSSSGRFVSIHTRAPGADAWQRLARVRTEDMASVSPIAPTEEPGVWYVAGRGPGEDRSAIWTYDMAETRYLERIFADDAVDVGNAFVNARGEFEGVSFEGERTRHAFRDPGVETHLAGLQAFVGADRDIVFEDDGVAGDQWLVRAVGPREPGQRVLYDRANRRAEFVGRVNPKLEPGELGRVEPVRFTARDGLEMTGYYTYPASYSQDKSAGAAPLVVMPHGGPDVRDYYEFDREAQFLATRGYAVFQPNFRGSSGFGDSFERAGHEQWGGAMQDDLLDGVDALVERGLADPDRVAVVGWSYGGYAALMGAARDGNRYRCAVSINGAADLPAMLRRDRKTFGKSSDAYKAMRDKLGDPKADRERLDRTSPVRLAGDVDIPLLVIAGEKDARIDADQSRDMAAAVEAAGGSVRLVVYPNADHGLEGVSPAAIATADVSDDDPAYAQKAMLGEVEAFLKVCLN